MKFTFRREVISLSLPAISCVNVSPSITQGPAMRNRGWSIPAWKWASCTGFAASWRGSEGYTSGRRPCSPDWPGGGNPSIRGSGDGKLHVHGDAPVRIATRPDPAAMGFDNRTADGESQTQALRFAGDEVLEHAFQLRLADPDAAVANLDDHGRRVGVADVDGHLPRAGGSQCNGFFGITQQVQDHLAHLHA